MPYLVAGLDYSVPRQRKAQTVPEKLQIVKAGVVLTRLELLGSSDEVEAFCETADTKTQFSGASINADIETGEQFQTRQFRLNRERVNIEVSPVRSSLQAEYPSPDGLALLATLVHAGVESLTLPPTSYEGAAGYNIEAECELGAGISSGAYLGSRLFSDAIRSLMDGHLDRGLAHFTFSDGTTLWNFRIEPRFNDPEASAVFVSLNQHKPLTALPSLTEISSGLTSSWDRVNDLVGLLKELEGEG